MDIKTTEVPEEKVVEVVRYASSKQMCLNKLSDLLVLEGGVDLDTLARVIREFRDGTRCAEEAVSAKVVVAPDFAAPVKSNSNRLMSDHWPELKKAG